MNSTFGQDSTSRCSPISLESSAREVSCQSASIKFVCCETGYFITSLYRDNLSEQHGQILETIGWVNQDMRNFVQVLDRFPEIYARGAEDYERDLTSMLET
jgi:hypothetical protein